MKVLKRKNVIVINNLKMLCTETCEVVFSNCALENGRVELSVVVFNVNESSGAYVSDSAEDEAGLEHRSGCLALGEKPSQPEAFAFSYSVCLFLAIGQIQYMLSDSVQKFTVFPLNFLDIYYHLSSILLSYCIYRESL